VKEFYLGVGGEGRKSFKDVKHYKRRKRWLADCGETALSAYPSGLWQNGRQATKRAIALNPPFRYVRPKAALLGNCHGRSCADRSSRTGRRWTTRSTRRPTMFLGHLAKYGTLVCVALMIAMAFGFFAGAASFPRRSSSF
jgi:hypothetical protein